MPAPVAKVSRVGTDRGGVNSPINPARRQRYCHGEAATGPAVRHRLRTGVPRGGSTSAKTLRRSSRPRRTTEADRQRNRLRRLRGTSDPESPARLFLATIRVRMPKGIWNSTFSTAHPTIRIEVLNRSDASTTRAVSDYWIEGAPPGVWAREIAAYPDVVKVDSLAEVGEGCLYRITYRNPPVVGLYRRLGLPLPLPFRMQAGYIDWEVVARYSDFQRIMAFARRVDPQLSVVSLRRRPLRTHLPLLTDPQADLLRDAMAAGYFAVPRGITLTELARKLHRSKSGISEMIALIEQKLMETALLPPRPSVA